MEASTAPEVVVKGESFCGMEDASTAGLDYRVLNYDQVRERLPELEAIYRDDALIATLSCMAGEPIKPFTDPISINVNYLMGKGKRYECHTDSCAYTLLVFVTTHHAGGRLCIADPADADALRGLTAPEMADRFLMKIPPRAGFGVLFKGLVTPHAVEELAEDAVRITIPMAFKSGTDVIDREGEEYAFTYTGYLYGEPK